MYRLVLTSTQKVWLLRWLQNGLSREACARGLNIACGSLNSLIQNDPVLRAAAEAAERRAALLPDDGA